MAFKLTPSNVDDRVPVPELAKGLTGKMFADKGVRKRAINIFVVAEKICK